MILSLDASNYFTTAKAALTNLDEEIDRLYAERGTNLFSDTKTPEETKARARKEIILLSAMKLARRAAFEFADELDQRGNHPDDLAKLAQEKGLTVRTTAPFDEETGPAEFASTTNDFAQAFAKAAFQLAADAPFNHDVSSDDAVYIIGLDKKIPSTIPAFKDVEAKVTADFREAQAYELAARAATNFTVTLAGELNVNNGVTLPKTFEDICAETGNKAESVPPFSISTTNLPPELAGRVDLQSLKNAGFGTDVGAASAPRNTSGGTFVLFVEKMLPVDETKVKAGVAQYLALLRNARENDAFDLWVNSQIQKDPGLMKTFQDLMKSMRETASAGSQ